MLAKTEKKPKHIFCSAADLHKANICIHTQREDIFKLISVLNKVH